MERSNPFNSTIESLNKTAVEIDEATRKMNEEDESREENDSKNQNNENTDPAYVLYNAIADNSIELLRNETVINTFRKIADTVGEDVSKSIIEMMAILMSQSAYHAIVFYDTLLKKELDNQFNHFAAHINTNRADIDAHSGVLKVFKQQLSTIQNSLKIEKFEEENNVTLDPNNH